MARSSDKKMQDTQVSVVKSAIMLTKAMNIFACLEKNLGKDEQ